MKIISGCVFGVGLSAVMIDSGNLVYVRLYRQGPLDKGRPLGAQMHCAARDLAGEHRDDDGERIGLGAAGGGEDDIGALSPGRMCPGQVAEH